METNPSQNSRFKEVGSSSNVDFFWKPYSDHANIPSMMGYLKDIVECNGPRGPFMMGVLICKDSSGKDVSVGIAGGKVLEDKLNNITLGKYICIEFKGKAKSKSGNTFNNWFVGVDDNVPLLSGVETKVTSPVKQQSPVMQQSNPFSQPVQSAPVSNSPVQAMGNTEFLNQGVANQAAYVPNQVAQPQMQVNQQPFNPNAAVPASTPQASFQAPVNNAPAFQPQSGPVSYGNLNDDLPF